MNHGDGELGNPRAGDKANAKERGGYHDDDATRS